MCARIAARAPDVRGSVRYHGQMDIAHISPIDSAECAHTVSFTFACPLDILFSPPEQADERPKKI